MTFQQQIHLGQDEFIRCCSKHSYPPRSTSLNWNCFDMIVQKEMHELWRGNKGCLMRAAAARPSRHFTAKFPSQWHVKIFHLRFSVVHVLFQNHHLLFPSSSPTFRSPEFRISLPSVLREQFFLVSTVPLRLHVTVIPVALRVNEPTPSIYFKF